MNKKILLILLLPLFLNNAYAKNNNHDYLREATGLAAGAAGGIAGAQYGAEIGAFGGPIGAFTGAIIGGTAGLLLYDKIND